MSYEIYAKIAQGERRDASLLAIFAEPQPQLVSVFTTDGRIVYNNQVTTLSLMLPAHCYVVQAGGKSMKVVVK